MKHNYQLSFRAWPTLLAWVLLASALVSEISMTANRHTDAISASSFGTLPNGRAVVLYTLRNHQGMEARINRRRGRG